ncbi:MAG: MgtC/SapB family protein [Clostridia bacterium]|nr:MgtC/SapB family protein [Clostridia bacterium]
MNPQIEYCIRIMIAALCGIALGYERYKRFKAAGPRVYSLVCSSSALLMVLSKYGFGDLVVNGDYVLGTHGADPSRIAAGVIGGISFICLAIIYRNKSSLRGLTTAGGLFLGSAIGLSIGAGMYVTGFFATVFSLVIQTVMHALRIDNDSMTNRDVTVRMVDDHEFRDKFVKEVESIGGTVSGRSICHNPDGTLTYCFMLKVDTKIHFEDMVAIMEAHPDQIFDIMME